jgi:very-short-patch-repair endonuclease
VAKFQELDRAHLTASRRYIAGLIESRLPSASAAQVASSEPAILMREAQKKVRLQPIRKLFSQIPVSLRRLKPCFLMSPLSVAQYLPADAEPFDLVVFDEASQICTHDAIGAIARGRQVIVVGDSRQLPPTSFFTRTDSEDEIPDDNDVEELESVLDEAVAKLIPQQWLGWHYRSRHESLIDFSNRHIYDHKLEVFPAAAFRSDDAGVHWRRVPNGLYRAGSGPEGRTNRPEAEALVAYLVGELKRRLPEERTFGVVTFNQPQQRLVLDLLDDARLDPEVDRHFAGLEPPFVKNLENVQGDERDEIIFSICSAPDTTGRFSISMGALNLAGGERRLNVAITRARRKLVVFSSIDPEHIDRSRSKARGIWLLRDFLTFARDGRRAVDGPREGHSGIGALEARIAQRLAAEGWKVDTGVGCSGYRLDLALRDPETPGRYAVAVEADGPAYRAAHTARDRDRLRTQVLASLGWRVERVWSSAWWFDDRAPSRLVERIQETLASRAPAELPAPPPVLAPSHAPIPQGVFNQLSAPRALAPPPEPAVYYQAAELPALAVSAEDFYRPIHDDLLRGHVRAVVRVEGPIHEKLLARRIVEHWGIGRLTANPLRRIGGAIDSLACAGELVRRGEFLWLPDVIPGEWLLVRGAPVGEEPPRDLPLVPPEEIANAGLRLLRDAGSLEQETLAREIARVFGVQRMGANVQEAVKRGIELLVGSGRAEVKEGRVQMLRNDGASR